jgi:hypothetical protein
MSSSQRAGHLTPSSSTTTATSPTIQNHAAILQSATNVNTNGSNNGNSYSGSDLLTRKRALEIETSEIENNHKQTMIQYNQGIARSLAENDMAKFKILKQCLDNYVAMYSGDTNKRPLVKLEADEESDNEITFLLEKAPLADFAKLIRPQFQSPLPVGAEARRAVASTSLKSLLGGVSSPTTNEPVLMHVCSLVNELTVELNENSLVTPKKRLKLKFKSALRQCGNEAKSGGGGGGILPPCSIKQPHVHYVISDSIRNPWKPTDYTRYILNKMGMQNATPIKAISKEQYKFISRNF